MTNSIMDGFEGFWQAYPRRVAKAAALRAFCRAMHKTDIVTLLDAIAKQRAAGLFDEMRYVPYPATWLNQERWGDEVVNTVWEECGRRCRAWNPDKRACSEGVKIQPEHCEKCRFF